MVDKKQMIVDLICRKRESTLKYYEHMNVPREYAKGEVLYMREAHFIEAVGDSNKTSMSDIARKMNISQGAVTQIADRLLNKKLIYKLSDSSDKRVKLIKLTERGEYVYHGHKMFDEQRIDYIVSLMDCFTIEEIQTCIKYEELSLELFKILK